MAAGLMKRKERPSEAAAERYTDDGRRIVRSEGVGVGLRWSGPGRSLISTPPPRSEYVAPFWAVDQNRTSLDAIGDGPGEPRKGAELWAKARAVKTTVKLTKRWHKDVDTWYKRLWLTFQGSHTLLAGLLYRGTVGFSRAQTVMMILSNSVALPLALPLTYR